MSELEARIDRPLRLRIEKHNRALLERELLEKRLEFASRPYEAHIQFSNFCNMSCIMCHDGTNPPLKKMSADVLAKVAEQVAPTLSVVIPYGGSEPLVLTWDAARDLARQHSIELRMTTNVQFLDEQTFEELKDITETLFLSIDSHIPELFEKIRPGSKPELVYENLATAARLAEQNGLECLAQIVFMTENASTLPDTIAYLADAGVRSVNVLQLIDVNGRSRYLDPLLHFSAEYVEWIKAKCIETVRRKKIRLIWNVAGWERHDFRAHKTPAKPRKDWNYRWEQSMKRRVPGYCMNVWNRVQITADGDVTPCCYATDGDLVLGQLAEQDFDSIWNGPNALDLRRGMATWDYPSLCSSCRFTDRPKPEAYLPFVEDVLDRLGIVPEGVDDTLSVTGPAHMARSPSAPLIELETPEEEIASYVLAIALGGETGELQIATLEPSALEDGGVALAIPDQVWAGLRTNLGYWWAVFAVSAEPGRVLRTPEIRCLIRHEPLARVKGSTLRYADEGHLPVADLGGAKQPGWIGQPAVPARPQLGARRTPLNGSRHRRNGASGSQDNGATPEPMTRDEYARMATQIRELAAEALPRDATVVVLSKGDDVLMRLDCRRVWHFPAGRDGHYIGYHPADSDGAVSALEQARSRGAEYLVVPATASWWLEHYRGFAEHVERLYPLVRREQCADIYALGRNPALYGRLREAEVEGHAGALLESSSRLSHVGAHAAEAGELALGRLSARRIGLGALHLAHMSDPANVRTLLHRALELGVNLVDTADVYGEGSSESRLAQALHPYPSELVIATKGGFVEEGGESRPDGRPEHLRAACEASLRRLRLDAIPLYQLHTPDPGVPLEDSLAALMELRAEGKIVEIGVSNVSADELEAALAIAPVVSVQNGYNLRRLRRRGPQPQVEICERAGIGFMAWQPLGAGAMQRPDSSMDGIARGRGATRAQVALAWLLCQSPAVMAIPGTSSVSHLEQNVAAAELKLSPDEMELLAPSRGETELLEPV